MAIFASLITGLTVAVWQYTEAKTEAYRAEETANLVKSLFDRINPESAGNEDITLRRILDETAIRIEKRITGLTGSVRRGHGTDRFRIQWAWR